MKLKLYSVLIGASVEGTLLFFRPGFHGCPGWDLPIGLLYFASHSPVESVLTGVFGAEKRGAESLAVAVALGVWVTAAYLMLRFVFKISDGTRPR